MQYLLDTNICIFFIRGKLNLDKMIRRIGLTNIFISEITVFELRYGAENSSNPNESHKVVEKFINGLSILPIYPAVRQYSETKVFLRENGTPMHDEFDLIIEVTALYNDLVLVTDNEKDFRFIKGLKIENWFYRT